VAAGAAATVEGVLSEADFVSSEGAGGGEAMVAVVVLAAETGVELGCDAHAATKVPMAKMLTDIADLFNI